jgi:arginyl-tRNA synthetase
MYIEKKLQKALQKAFVTCYETEVPLAKLVVAPTPPHFQGEYTLPLFALASVVGKSPAILAGEVGKCLVRHSPLIKSYSVVKGFLNLSLAEGIWHDALAKEPDTKREGEVVVLEIAAPNTNKPLHLGHLRNTFLGDAVARLLATQGDQVKRINHINDRGIHICKSMIAYQRHGDGTTPQSCGMKGDHFVGHYYVKFDQLYKEEVKALTATLGDEKRAKKEAPILLAAQALLRAWEGGDHEVIALWKRMNGWVYEGFDATYQQMGVAFDKTYHESDTYLLGKEIVQQGLSKGIFYAQEDGSIWIDLAEEGMDQKLLLRGDGTAVYMTQDMGTADVRYEDFHFDRSIYVVGNEQNYHFKVLFAIMQRLGRSYATRLSHLSYGMVDLPSGKMKSREGTVVDADELIAEMAEIAKVRTKELGKADNFTPEEAEDLYKMLAMGALKYLLLKVNPQKRILFDPKASIDFQGDTGPFIQYTHARICSVLRKVGVADKAMALPPFTAPLAAEEKALIGLLTLFEQKLEEATRSQNPSLIAQYVHQLAKVYNRFYAHLPIAKTAEESLRLQRGYLSQRTALTLRRGMQVLGVAVPERM